MCIFGSVAGKLILIVCVINCNGIAGNTFWTYEYYSITWMLHWYWAVYGVWCVCVFCCSEMVTHCSVRSISVNTLQYVLLTDLRLLVQRGVSCLLPRKSDTWRKVPRLVTSIFVIWFYFISNAMPVTENYIMLLLWQIDLWCTE